MALGLRLHIMNKLSVISGILVISPVFLLGSFLLVKGLRNIQMSFASVHWPKAAGMVVSSVTTRTAPTQDRTLRSMGDGPRLPDYATFGTNTKLATPSMVANTRPTCLTSARPWGRAIGP